MIYVLIFLHVFVSIALIGIVLLQSGKGAEMGASFGAGGSQSVFGASGGNTFMNKLTTGAAIIFMLTSLTLAHLSSSGSSSSIMSGKKAPAARRLRPSRLHRQHRQLPRVQLRQHQRLRQHQQLRQLRQNSSFLLTAAAVCGK